MCGVSFHISVLSLSSLSVGTLNKDDLQSGEDIKLLQITLGDRIKQKSGLRFRAWWKYLASWQVWRKIFVWFHPLTLPSTTYTKFLLSRAEMWAQYITKGLWVSCNYSWRMGQAADSASQIQTGASVEQGRRCWGCCRQAVPHGEGSFSVLGHFLTHCTLTLHEGAFSSWAPLRQDPAEHLVCRTDPSGGNFLCSHKEKKAILVVLVTTTRQVTFESMKKERLHHCSVHPSHANSQAGKAEEGVGQLLGQQVCDRIRCGRSRGERQWSVEQNPLFPNSHGCVIDSSFHFWRINSAKLS